MLRYIDNCSDCGAEMYQLEASDIGLIIIDESSSAPCLWCGTHIPVEFIEEPDEDDQSWEPDKSYLAGIDYASGYFD